MLRAGALLMFESSSKFPVFARGNSLMITNWFRFILVVCNVSLVCGLLHKIHPALTQTWISLLTRYILSLETEIGV